MVRRALASQRNRLRGELEAAFSEDHAPEDVAASFALGVFITTLPTLGVGLLVFLAIAYVWDRVSKLALFASVVVFNPVVKWGVYGTSFWLGSRLLGAIPGVTLSTVSLSAGPEVLVRLLVGNIVLAIAFTIVGYVVALRLAREFRRRDLDVGDLLSESLGD